MLRIGVSLFNAGDSAKVMVNKTLKATSDSDTYWAALRAATDIEQEKGLSLIIDGIDETQHQNHEFIRELCVFIENLRKRPSATRVLLTSRPQAEIKEILGWLPCTSIEYDRERKSLICPISLSPDTQGS